MTTPNPFSCRTIGSKFSKNVYAIRAFWHELGKAADAHDNSIVHTFSQEMAEGVFGLALDSLPKDPDAREQVLGNEIETKMGDPEVTARLLKLVRTWHRNPPSHGNSL